MIKGRSIRSRKRSRSCIRVEDFDLADVPSRELLAELERRLR